MLELDTGLRGSVGPSACTDSSVWVRRLKDAMALGPTGPPEDALIGDRLPFHKMQSCSSIGTDSIDKTHRSSTYG
jgi:hypothetical protein